MTTPSGRVNECYWVLDTTTNNRYYELFDTIEDAQDCAARWNRRPNLSIMRSGQIIEERKSR